MGDSLCSELWALEEALLRLEGDAPSELLDTLLAADFVEFGSSGRIWTKAEIVHELASAGPRSITAADIACRQLGRDAALLTYRTGDPRASLRCSLWVRDGGRWRMAFHQGTPLPPE